MNEMQEPGEHVEAPATWAHHRGPLHALLSTQGGACAICRVAAAWKIDVSGQTQCNLKQWVEDGELLGLTCMPCLRRYKGQPPFGDMYDDAVRDFLADPPARRCRDVAGTGPHARPRCLDTTLAPVEEPVAGKWSYHGTIIHSLFLWQRGRCAICSTGLQVQTCPKAVHVDHDPANDLIRGLLCRRCNTCLGQAWSLSWWEHLAPIVQAYLEHPPAQVFPATRGSGMARRHKPAVTTRSADGQQELLDGMPTAIGVASAGPASPSDRYCVIEYAREAPTGLPPVVRATHVLEVPDEEGRAWLMFLLDGACPTSLCVHRVAAEHVVSLRERSTLEEALRIAVWR